MKKIWGVIEKSREADEMREREREREFHECYLSLLITWILLPSE